MSYIGGNISIKQLAQKIVHIINRADPNKHVSVHQIRKVGASFNSFLYLNFKELKKYTHWKSAKVFYKHYMKQISKLSVPVIAAGKVIRPR